MLREEAEGSEEGQLFCPNILGSSGAYTDAYWLEMVSATSANKMSLPRVEVRPLACTRELHLFSSCILAVTVFDGLSLGWTM